MTKLDNQDRAAQLWCLPQHGNKEMDVDFAQSIAQALDAAEQRGRDEVLLEPCREGAPKDSAGVDRYPCHCCLKCKLSEAEAKHLNRESELLKTITKERTIALDSQARLAEMEKVVEAAKEECVEKCGYGGCGGQPETVKALAALAKSKENKL